MRLLRFFFTFFLVLKSVKISVFLTLTDQLNSDQPPTGMHGMAQHGAQERLSLFTRP